MMPLSWPLKGSVSPWHKEAERKRVLVLGHLSRYCRHQFEGDCMPSPLFDEPEVP